MCTFFFEKCGFQILHKPFLKLKLSCTIDVLNVSASNLRKTEILLTVCKLIPNLIAALKHSTAFYLILWNMVLFSYSFQFPPLISVIWAWRVRENEAKMSILQMAYSMFPELKQLSRKRLSKLNLAEILLRGDFSIRQ